MPIDFSLLNKSFSEKAKQVIEKCELYGITMVPFFGLRSLQDQAKLWRQSRTSEEVHQAIGELRERGADYLASVMQDVGPTFGRWATNAAPGLSWHNWGEALDCLWVKYKGRPTSPAERDGREGEGYRTYANIAMDCGLAAGYNFRCKDGVHIQLRSHEIPSLMSIKEVNDHFLSLSKSANK